MSPPPLRRGSASPLNFELPRVTGSYDHQPRDAACPFPRTGLRRSPPASASGTSGKAPWARYVARRLPLGLHKASPRRDYQHGPALARAGRRIANARVRLIDPPFSRDRSTKRSTNKRAGLRTFAARGARVSTIDMVGHGQPEGFHLQGIAADAGGWISAQRYCEPRLTDSDHSGCFPLRTELPRLLHRCAGGACRTAPA